MKVNFLDLKVQYQSIKDEISLAVQNVLDNTAFALGKSVADFEVNFASAHGVKNCAGVSSGTDGNHMVLWAIGAGPGDEVIIPANTFIATAWGATLCGATPVFVDVEADSNNIDAKKIAKAITPKTKAIVAVHLYGQPADMDAINYELLNIGFLLKTCRNDSGVDNMGSSLDHAGMTGEQQGVFVHKETGQVIYLVEDCAQSHISEYKNKKVGGLGYASSFSFYPGKNLGAYGEGGAVCTNDDELAVKFKMIRDHGSKVKYTHEIYGHNYRMEGIQGAVLGVKLKYLEKWTEGRRRAAGRYMEMLKGVEQIELPKEMDYSKHVYHLYVIKVKGNLRDELGKYLNENGIATGLHYPIPLHLQPCFKHLGYKQGDFPVTENSASTGLSLPMYAELTDEQLEYVADRIISFFKS